MKHSIPIPCILVLSGLIAGATAQTDNGLKVTNGDFSQVAGLTTISDTWYAGVPAGWTGLSASGTANEYAIWREATENYSANVSALSQRGPKFVALAQEVGQVSGASTVTLAFELRDPWHDPAFILGAAIYDAVTDVPLTHGQYTNCGSHVLVATNVPSGTRVKIGFWSARGFPNLDNVSIRSERPPLQVENGDFQRVADLTAMGGGWYSGVPGGWIGLAPSGISTNYTVWREESGNVVANVSALSQVDPSFVALTQEVGQVPEVSEVTLTFELREPWHDPSFLLGAAIYDSVSGLPLVNGDFTQVGLHKLVATNVPSGTSLRIGFWSARGFPRLDRVEITSKIAP